MAAAKPKSTAKGKKSTLRRSGKQTLVMAGKAIERARKKVGITRQRLSEMLNSTVEGISRIEAGSALVPLNRMKEIFQALKIPQQDAAFIKVPMEKARALSQKVSGNAVRVWKRLSERERSELTRLTLDLGRHLPAIKKPPSEEERVVFALRASAGNSARFQRLLAVLEIPMASASKIVTGRLAVELAGRRKEAARKAAPGKKSA